MFQKGMWASSDTDLEQEQHEPSHTQGVDGTLSIRACPSSSLAAPTHRGFVDFSFLWSVVLVFGGLVTHRLSRA